MAPIEATTGAILAEMHDDITADVVHLGDSIPSPEKVPAIALTRHLVREVQAHPQESVAYRIPPREPRLREELAKYLLEGGCVVSPGDIVAIESPAYFSFIQQLERLHLQAIEVPSPPSGDMSLEALQYVLEHERVAACLLSANFSNPTGSLMTEQNKRRLVDLLNRNGVPLIEDDMFGDIFFGRDRPRAVKAFDDQGNVLLCSSFSWTLCPGCRVGRIVPGKYRSRVEQAKRTMSIATSALGQMAVASYLSSGAHVRHLRKVRAHYASNMEMVSDAVARSFPAGTRMTRPMGGLMLWVELPHDIDAIQLYHSARNRGISIAPGPAFSLTGKFRNCLRISAQHWSEQIEEAIEAVGALCGEHS